MRKNIKSPIFLLVFFLACAGGVKYVENDEITFWKYVKPEEENKSISKPKLIFSELQKTVDIKLTNDSSLVGCWISSNISGYSFSSVNYELQFHLWDYNYQKNEIINLFKSQCAYQLDTRKNKTIIRAFCRGGHEFHYYAISTEDSSLLKFNTTNDSLENRYKKIKYPLEPINEKQARYQLYKERDTLTIGWYMNERGLVDKRLIGKYGIIYIMDLSEYGYEVNKAQVSPHSLGTRLDVKPWNELSKAFFEKMKPYDILSKDSSILYSYSIYKGEEVVETRKRITRNKYDNWIDEHLFGSESKGEPWR